MKERTKFFLLVLVFLAAYFIPFSNLNIKNAVIESLLLLHEYAREHVLFCLVPAFFIAGAISNFLSQDAVIRYFGVKANKVLSYAVASVSGTILAVCSCTVLPLFAGIYQRGAGLGPATAFLYSGPAVNILAIIFTARVLGIEIGLVRAAGAVFSAVLIGLAMHFIFIKDELKREAGMDFKAEASEENRPLWKTAVYFFTMIAILVFINWNNTGGNKVWEFISTFKYYITGFFLLLLIYMVFKWFKKNELEMWTFSTWGFTKQIFPLLFAGVIVAGFLFGRPGHNGIIPSGWVESLVGGNSLIANFFASIFGAFMYFATLTEVPVLQGLISAGMGKGPALALLLAGPALSLPNMIVIKNVLGIKKIIVYVVLVVIFSSLFGFFYGKME